MSRILIIDDEEDFSSIVKQMLERAGKYKVHTFTSGKDGIKAALRKKPNLILLDIEMPEMSGFEVLKELKEKKKTMSIPVVMLTGRNDEESIEKAVGSYCESYLVKPVKAEDLLSKVENVLSLHKMQKGWF